MKRLIETIRPLRELWADMQRRAGGLIPSRVIDRSEYNEKTTEMLQ